MALCRNAVPVSLLFAPAATTLCIHPAVTERNADPAVTDMTQKCPSGYQRQNNAHLRMIHLHALQCTEPLVENHAYLKCLCDGLLLNAAHCCQCLAKAAEVTAVCGSRCLCIHLVSLCQPVNTNPQLQQGQGQPLTYGNQQQPVGRIMT